MNKYIRTLVVACAVNVLVAPAAFSQTDLSKDEAREQASNVCQIQAQQRYGEKSVKSTSSKVKWNRDLNGASVKMKIKPKYKSTSKYVCVFGLDKSVIFYKA
jgi:hypothetical protein